MKLYVQKLALAFFVMTIGALPAFSQNYPLPGSSSAAPVVCTNCNKADGNPTFNIHGQNNTGLKTWPYSSPIKKHVGRVVDSTIVTDFQGYFRTARAKQIRFARSQRGSAPPRAYVQIGSAVAAFNLDTFFTSTLPQGTAAINELVRVPQAGRGQYPMERVARWDAFIYPEASGSGWVTPHQDGQERLNDFDYDDRGYVYFASGNLFGFGIHKDNGEGGVSLLPLIHQVVPPLSVTPETIVAVRAGSKYYAVISGMTGGRQTYDVTNPAAPSASVLRAGEQNAVASWAKDEDRSVVGIVTASGTVEIWDNNAFAIGGSPIASFPASAGSMFADITIDESGNFWTLRTTGSSSVFVKFKRTSSGYAEESFNVIGESFVPLGSTSKQVITYGDKYLTIVGKVRIDGAEKTDVLLFKVDGGTPTKVDLGRFFAKYYHAASPAGYANPPFPARMNITGGAYTIKWGSKLYLVYQIFGLGDVFEIEAGDSISATRRNVKAGTTNPYAASTASGPFYGDILTFNATSSNPTFGYNLTWNFGNPEAGAALNVRAGRTGNDITHQFTGLGTSAAVGATKLVKVHSINDTSMEDSVAVELATPVARVGIKGTNVVVEADGSPLAVVAGDELVDASDGEVEGHYSAWTIDGAVTNLKPNQPIAVGAVGAHTARLDSRYGSYDANFQTTGTPFVESVTGLSYVVRPFVVNFTPAAATTTAVTFKGAARKTTILSVLGAANWTVDWSLKNGTTDVVPVQSSTVAVGTIPDFVVNDKSLITSGSVLTLKVTVDPSGLSAEAAPYASHSVSQELVTPDPKVTKSGCANTGAPCSFTLGSIAGRSMSDWTIKWELRVGTTVKQTGTKQTFAPTLTEPGTYNVKVTATNNLFEGTATVSSFNVEGPICGDPPTADQLAIFTSCTSNCEAGSPITIRADPWHYNLQGCEEFQWSFGDGQSETTTSRSTTHTYTSTTARTISLKIKKGTQTSVTFTKSISFSGGTTNPPPGDTCTSPSGITITYTGTKGCGPNKACVTGERVTFTAKRGPGSLQDCDSTAWTFHDQSTSASRAPSKTYSAVGTYDVTVVVTNSKGTASPKTIQVPVVADGQVDCGAPPTVNQLVISYKGRTSGCTAINSTNCQAGETIDLTAVPFQYQFQSCDRFEWDFGDNSAKGSGQATTHVYAAGTPSFLVKLRVYNATNSTGATVSQAVQFNNVPLKPIPVLAFSGFPARGAKGTPVTFRVNSNINATAWEWTFSDVTGTDRSQAAVISTSSVMQHTFARTGTFTVTAKARNAEAASNEPMAVVTGQITIDETPEYKYLLPVVTHIGGSNGSSWRTDVQIYHPDTTVSPQNPTHATAKLRDIERPLEIFASTMILEDFMRTFTFSDDAGPVIITVRGTHAPQIWTRTYNQTVDGTFGQFIPAIRLDAAGGGSAVGEGTYYLAGLWSDARYRSNIGFVNPTAQAMTATIRVYDDERMPIGQFTRTLQPFQLDQINNLRGLVAGLPTDHPFTLEIDVPAGQWLIAYASFIDSGSNDPVYIQAVRASDLSSPDNREIIIPGIGHTGAWRSDVTIFNPDTLPISIDLEYLDASGTKVGEAKSLPVGQGELVQYQDIIRQGVLGGAVPDGVGMLRLKVLDSPIPNTRFPMAVARTYNDDGSGKTYGQGISGFASAKANLKPGRPALIPGIRSSSSYYTNIGVTNTTATPSTVTVKMLDPISGAESVLMSIELAAFQSVVGPLNLGAIERGSLKLEVTGGNVWAFASIIDRGTKDPEYIPATPLAQ